jgi:hypothetical protein
MLYDRFNDRKTYYSDIYFPPLSRLPTTKPLACAAPLSPSCERGAQNSRPMLSRGDAADSANSLGSPSPTGLSLRFALPSPSRTAVVRTDCQSLFFGAPASRIPTHSLRSKLSSIMSWASFRLRKIYFSKPPFAKQKNII